MDLQQLQQHFQRQSNKNNEARRTNSRAHSTSLPHQPGQVSPCQEYFEGEGDVSLGGSRGYVVPLGSNRLAHVMQDLPQSGVELGAAHGCMGGAEKYGTFGIAAALLGSTDMLR